ncbi:MAG: efflux RND transporter permease subunit [Planctomycetota bacterium]|jgi:multidrug efflux pump|nr:efflux RND transporter permease subunit [Planctomycetota bacterium]
MTISHFSIVRPVVTTVLMLLLVVFGGLSISRLAVSEYPKVDTPTISISTAYTGASAAVVETKITRIIEDSVAGIEGLRSITSSSRDGTSRITLEFFADRDIDGAANDVRDKVARVANRLPDEADASVIAKFDAGGMPVMILALSSNSRSRMELTDYVNRYLLDRFSVIDGVASADIFGREDPAIRIWLDRQAMAAKGVTVGDIEDALRRENVETPGGRIESAAREFTVRLARQYHQPDDFAALVIARAAARGDLIRLRDIATVNLEPRRLRQAFAINREPMIGIGIFKQSTANTLSVAAATRRLTDAVAAELPADMKIIIRRDDSQFINAAVREVSASLIVATALVIAVIFFFLGNVRAAAIPALTVPISLVAAFIVLQLCGFSINLLTLLALVLAIGLVVDDTIVMVENIHRRVEEGEPPLLAAVRGAKQVFFAVVATTVVLVAAFMPICLWQGQTGRLFTEFAVTITAAVLFSTAVALTLTPMLCSKLFRPRAEDSFLTRLVDGVMARVEKFYLAGLRRFTRHRFLAACAFAALCVLTALGWQRLPSEYEPQEDRSVVMMRLTAPEGTNFYAMLDNAAAVTDAVYPLVDSGVATSFMSVVPSFGGGDGAVNRGFGIFELVEPERRALSAAGLMSKLRAEVAPLPGVRVQPFLPAGIGARGSPVQFVIGGPDYDELVQWRDRILAACATYPGLTDVDYDYKETTPQFHINIDRDRADALGVSAKTIGDTLETMLGSKQVTTFVDRGREYDVVLQAGRESRAGPTDLNNLYVRSTRGELLPLDSVLKISERGEAGDLSRYNRVRAITISGNVASGYALSDALKFLQDTANRELPEYKQIFYKGQSKDMLESSQSMALIFLLALTVSYLTLSAQFESFVAPAVVMLTVPLGLVGAVAALNWLNLTLNIYSQIGVIMLIGLAAKNGILIVDFANQLRDGGAPFAEAVFQAAKLRLRPVLMTGISTVAGALPLLLATGAGAMSRRNLGAVVVFGGFTSCVLTLFVVPLAYLLLMKWSGSPQEIAQKLAALEAKNNPLND